MTKVVSQITSLTVVYSIVYSNADQRKDQSCASLAIVRGIHRWPVNSPHKGPVTRKMFPFNDVMYKENNNIISFLQIVRQRKHWLDQRYSDGTPELDLTKIIFVFGVFIFLSFMTTLNIGIDPYCTTYHISVHGTWCIENQIIRCAQNISLFFLECSNYGRCPELLM